MPIENLAAIVMSLLSSHLYYICSNQISHIQVSHFAHSCNCPLQSQIIQSKLSAETWYQTKSRQGKHCEKTVKHLQ